ncbi:hypothetical protein [Streptomyces huasconensis]|uniref:hypothetical protein n=1 Tax=Streptomyces huasconensis TaxID=1854574 RepID=UPI0036F7F485
MRPNRCHEFVREALAKAPDIQAVDTWEGRAFGLHITFTTGSQIWAGMTFAAAPGDKGDGPETPVHGETPAEVPMPELFKDGKVSPTGAEVYLAAALTNAHCDEVESAYPYGSEAKNSGVGLRFHSGARAFILFELAGRPGQSAGGQKYNLPAAF